MRSSTLDLLAVGAVHPHHSRIGVVGVEREVEMVVVVRHPHLGVLASGGALDGGHLHEFGEVRRSLPHGVVEPTVDLRWSHRSAHDGGGPARYGHRRVPGPTSSCRLPASRSRPRPRWLAPAGRRRDAADPSRRPPGSRVSSTAASPVTGSRSAGAGASWPSETMVGPARRYSANPVLISSCASNSSSNEPSTMAACSTAPVARSTSRAVIRSRSPTR